VGMTGRVWHAYDQTKQSLGWKGMTDFEQGDVLGLLLECNEGTLSVFKNGVRLGVAVGSGLRVEQGAAAVASFLAAVLTAIYLCNVCSCQN
jgi:hypothetical protein